MAVIVSIVGLFQIRVTFLALPVVNPIVVVWGISWQFF